MVNRLLTFEITTVSAALDDKLPTDVKAGKSGALIG